MLPIKIISLFIPALTLTVNCLAQDKIAKEQTKEASKMDFNYKQQSRKFWEDKLAPEVLHVCRDRGTEKAGSGKYDKFYEKGTYNCACCGGDFPLFSSETKFDSGTGWPSFWAPIDEKNVELKPEDRLFSRLLGATTEVLCARCGSHLGHVFDDGPKEQTGKRFCMNSVALYFIPEGESTKRLFSVE